MAISPIVLEAISLRPFERNVASIPSAAWSAASGSTGRRVRALASPSVSLSRSNSSRAPLLLSTTRRADSTRS